MADLPADKPGSSAGCADALDATEATRRAWMLIGGFLVVRLLVAAILPAIIDEAYGVVVSRGWSLSYFDHPPVCFTLARLMAWMTGSENIFFLRLPFVLAGAVSDWLVYDITRIAYGFRPALWALAWYSIAPFFLISAGHFVVPDGPLDLFLLATLRLVLPDLLTPGRPPRAGAWLAAGLCFAMALASKYQALLFGASALGFLLASPDHRRLFRSPVLWLTLAVAMIGLVPTLLWNAAHGWISFGFQAGRAGTQTMELQPVNFVLTVLGQMVYVLPGTWLVMMATAARGLVRPRSTADRVFAWFTLLPPLIFLTIAIVSRKSLPHWAMSGFLCGFPLVGEWTVRMLPRFGRAIRAAWGATAVAVVSFAIIFSLQARYACFTRPFMRSAPRYDITWQFQDWPALTAAWGELGTPQAVVVNNWVTAAKAAHALGPRVAVMPFSDPRHFQFLDRGRAATVVAIQPAAHGEAAKAYEGFARSLRKHGYAIIGPPQVIQQRAGDHLRFEIVAVQVERKAGG